MRSARWLGARRGAASRGRRHPVQAVAAVLVGGLLIVPFGLSLSSVQPATVVAASASPADEPTGAVAVCAAVAEGSTDLGDVLAWMRLEGSDARVDDPSFVVSTFTHPARVIADRAEQAGWRRMSAIADEAAAEYTRWAVAAGRFSGIADHHDIDVVLTFDARMATECERRLGTGWLREVAHAEAP